MKRTTSLLLFTFALLAFIIGSFSSPITSLPGYNGPKLSMDSGYITLANNHSMFYWLVESQSSPSTDPLVLWLQGGPGCSGLIGLLTENGPFTATNNGQNLTYNPLSWSKMVNMLYIEAPVGVGFSYSPYPYVSNDTGTAQDNYNFILEFLNEFPEYKGRDFWITGESYGGIYIPTLSDLIVSNSSSQLYSQFKGFMAGNPVFSCVTANYNSIQFNLLYWHGLVSFSNYALWL